MVTTMPGAAAATDQDRKTPGRPRSARADEAIIDAVLDLLGEGVAFEALSIESVASRAGVGKATIYRRWPNKDALLVDAIGSLKGAPPELAGESVRDDLIALLRPVGQHNPASRAVRIMPCLMAELQRSPDLQRIYQRILAPRRELTRSVLRRGIDSGELRADLDVELIMALLVGPILVQSLVRWNPNLDGERLPERVVDALWPAIAAG